MRIEIKNANAVNIRPVPGGLELACGGVSFTIPRHRVRAVAEELEAKDGPAPAAVRVWLGGDKFAEVAGPGDALFELGIRLLAWLSHIEGGEARES